MKKLLCIVCLICLFGTSSLSAQELWKPYYGITAGINIANVARDNGGDAIARFNAGVFGGYRVTPHFAVEAQLFYSCSGTSVFSNEVRDDVHLNINYLTLPIYAKIRLFGGFSVHAGIQSGVLISQKINYRSEKHSSDFPIRKMDFAIPVRIGWEIGRLGIFGRYQQGIVNTFKEGPNEKNSMFTINLAFRI